MKAKKAQPTDSRTWITPLYEVIEYINQARGQRKLPLYPHDRPLTADEVAWCDANVPSWSTLR